MSEGKTGRRRSVERGLSFKAASQLMMAGIKTGKTEHAELGIDIDEAQIGVSPDESLIRNRALLHYIATLANSNSNTDMFSYSFVQSLIDGGGNLNEAVDMYGQTMFHEVARSWNLDVAKFLLNNGANLNQQDKYGRSPLHVSAAADHHDMVEFLLQNGADIDAKSKGDEQTPLHYAAKNDAVRSLNALLGFGANIDSLDCQGRTALQVAAELSRSESVRVLIEEGASSCVYDTHGSSAMTVLIEKLPKLAIGALDQLHLTNSITSSDLFYLYLLEESRQKKTTKKARTPLETAVTNQQFDVIMHPVMQRLITVKWLHYGRFGTILDLAINLIYAILFTVFAVATPKDGKDLYTPMRANVWRLIVGSIIIAVTSYQMYLQIKSTYKSREKQKSWIKWRTDQLKNDLGYCHPKWQEEKHIRNEMKIVKSLPLLSSVGTWFFFDWFIIILILVSIGLNFSYYFVNTASIKSAYVRILTILVILVWIRIMKYLRPFAGIGTLVLILGSTGSDFLNWAFFFILLYIPFTCSFWIIFGGLSYNKVEWFSKVPRLIYTMFQISVGEDYNIDDLVEADHVMARLLSALFITAMVIVCLNILIAYLSNTFTRVYEKAVENTNMQRAMNILNIEKFISSKRLKKFYVHLRQNANPEVVPWSPVVAVDQRLEAKAVLEMETNVHKANEILNQRFKRQVGKGVQSTFDALLENVKNIKTHQVNLVEDLVKIQSVFDDLGSILNVDTTMSFNFVDLMKNTVTDQHRFSRHDSTSSMRSLDFPFEGIENELSKRNIAQRTRQLSGSEEENQPTGKVKPKGKGVLTKFKRSKLGKTKEEEDEEVEDQEEQDEENETKSKRKDQRLRSKTKLSKPMEEVPELEELNEDVFDDGDDDDDDVREKQGRASRMFKKVSLMKSKGKEQNDPSKKVHFKASDETDSAQYQARNPRFERRSETEPGNQSRARSSMTETDRPSLDVVPYLAPNSRLNDGFAEEFLSDGRSDENAWEKISIDSISV